MVTTIFKTFLCNINRFVCIAQKVNLQKQETCLHSMKKYESKGIKMITSLLS